MPALRHTGSHIAWQGTGSATVSMQGMQEDIQCGNRHPLVGPAPQGQVACPLEPVLPMGRRFVLRQNVAGLPSIPPSVGGTAFSPQKTRKHAGSRALWKLMKPVFCKAKRANETLRARRAAGEARPPNGACRMNRFRSWLPLTAAGRQSVDLFRNREISAIPASPKQWSLPEWPY